MVRGFSRFVLFLFLGPLRAAMRNSPERVRDTIWTLPEKSGNRSRFWGRGCDEALFSEKKGFSVKRGEAIQRMRGLVRISTGKAIQWRGSGHSVNRRTLKTEKSLSSSPFRESALRETPPVWKPLGLASLKTTIPPRFLFSRGINQGRKNSININFLVRISSGHSWPLRPDDPGSKSFSPSPGPQKNALFGADVHDFWRGRPWPEGFLKNFVQKKFALIFWPLIKPFWAEVRILSSWPTLMQLQQPWWCLRGAPATSRRWSSVPGLLRKQVRGSNSLSVWEWRSLSFFLKKAGKTPQRKTKDL